MSTAYATQLYEKYDEEININYDNVYNSMVSFVIPLDVSNEPTPGGLSVYS
jgi:hypothetical protein